MFCNIIGLLDIQTISIKPVTRIQWPRQFPLLHIYSQELLLYHTRLTHIFSTHFHCSTQPELTYPLQLYDNKLLVCWRLCGVSRIRMNGVVRHALQECEQADSV